MNVYLLALFVLRNRFCCIVTGFVLVPGGSRPRDVSRQQTNDHQNVSDHDPPQFVKFPRTAHLIDMGASTSDDIVVNKKAALGHILNKGLVVEEKLDGANLGISCDADGEIWIQNRGNYVDSTSHPQFAGLTTWLNVHRRELLELLGNNTILYGEWLGARHSIPYRKLPGYFVAFDMYDKTECKFLSRRRFLAKMKDTGVIPVVPTLLAKQTVNDMQMLLNLLDHESAFRTDGGPVEGICLKIDDDKDQWLDERFKIVRGDFTASIDQHWSKRKPMERNLVDYSFAEDYLATCFSSSPSPSPIPLTDQQLREKRKRQRSIPRCVMLMGLPGSGKSWFATRLVKGSEDDWIYVNQDTQGRKESLHLASKANRRRRVIIDRCHVTSSERTRWWQAMNSPAPPSQVALVYFSCTPNECTERVERRKQHPTLSQEKGATVVRSMAANLEPPSPRETMFGTVETVSSFTEAKDLLRRWGVEDDQGR